MSHTLRGLRFDAPNDFSPDEAILSLRAPMPDLKTPLAMNRALTVRPNLIVHRRMVADGTSVEMICGEVCAELASAIPSMENMATARMKFKDGAVGMLVSFDFAATEHAKVRQFQALRLDASLLTTMTLSVDATTLTDELTKHWLDVLASASLVEAGL
ncbi:MAG: DcrB-related protein [Deltaproteobacteria bacterium]|nr:DcrB-related protein [Deltaproteobacteria bacterium]